MSEESGARPACECYVLPEDQWLSAFSCGYGSGYEPGSQMEWNPDCPAHPPTPVDPSATRPPFARGV